MLFTHFEGRHSFLTCRQAERRWWFFFRTTRKLESWQRRRAAMILWKPDNHRWLEKFLLFLTLCHLPLPGLRRHVSAYDPPPARPHWSIAERHLSRALTRLVSGAVARDLTVGRFIDDAAPPPSHLRASTGRAGLQAGEQWRHQSVTVGRVVMADGCRASRVSEL